MTIPKIELVHGSGDTEEIILMCTGCEEYYSYSVRQYKGDFGCNRSEFEQFLQWAMWDAARHECFLAGRMDYLPPDFFEGVERGVRAAKEGRVTPFDEDDPLTYHVDFPQEDMEKLAADGGRMAERHEDPWSEEAMRGGYWPDEFDEDEEFWPDAACMSHEECDMEPCIYAGEKEEDEDEFGFWAGPILGTVTGRLTRRLPIGILTFRAVPQTTQAEVVYIEFDYAEMEQRVVDEWLLREGVYSLDDHGCLRDEKGRCLACLRPGPHFPFYYERPE